MEQIKWHFCWWFNYFVLTLLLRRKIEYDERKYELERWGSRYGGWYIPVRLLKKNWTYYLVGVGDDITFDISLIKRVGCDVHLFDPTPESIKYMRKFRKNSNIHFYPIGIWNKDETAQFKKPQDSTWKTYSIPDLHGSGQSAFEAPCRRLKTVMKELKHKKIDLLKLDVDGAEYRVIEDTFASHIRPKILLVDFDQPVFVLKTYKMIEKILHKGYSLAVREMWNFTFIKTD